MRTVPAPWPSELSVAAVIFDMDGLLLDTERLAMKALADAGTALALDLPDEFPETLIGIPADTCRSMAVRQFGRDFPVEAYFSLAGDFLEQAVEAGELMLKPGVTETLDALDGLGMRRAVATSSARDKATRHLRRTGLMDRFDAVVTRDDVDRGKPHPDLFLKAARALRVTPEHCLALEDSYNGVRAAHAARTQVIMIPDLLPAIQEMHEKCLLIAGSLHEIHPILARRQP